MGTVVGTNRDDDRLEDSPFQNEFDVIFGLRGNDSLFGGRGQDSLFGGPGSDYLSGGRQIDYYHFVLGSGDDVIDEFEDQPDLNGSAQNSADRLRFWTPETEFTEEAFLDLEDITDAFLVLQGETLDSPTPVSNRIEYGAFFYTRGDSLQIEDQYGDNSGNPPPSNDRHDGIEYISLQYLSFLGNRITREFQFYENQGAIEARDQRGDDLLGDLLIGSRGDDSFFGRGGQDLIFTGAGDDDVFGGSSVDHIHASRGTNFLDGGDTNDYYYWNRDFRARNTIREVNAGDNDMIAADFSAADLNRAVAESESADLVLGFAKAANLAKELSSFRLEDQFSTETLIETYDIELIRFDGKVYRLQQDFSRMGTNEGELIAMSESGGDRIRAGGGDDLIFANGGKDNVKGQGGNDIINGGALQDRLHGGGGADLLRGGAKNDVLIGGAGKDTADYRTSEDGVKVDLSRTRQKSGDAAGDKLRGIENVTGSEQKDDLRGDSGGNELRGRAGADVVRGGGGNDEVRGDGGNDRGYGGGGRDEVWGGGGRDRLWGDGGKDKIWVGGGNDKAWGGGGDDKIWGGGGKDKLWGDGGDDTFYGSGGKDTYYVGASDNDRIVRFDADGDKIAFTGSGAPTSMRDLNISRNGSDVVVRWDGGRLDLDDVDRKDLGGADFIF